MRQVRFDRETGSGLALVLIIITVLMALAGSMTLLALSGLGSVKESHDLMQAFYLADSGAQSGIARVRASNGTMAATTYNETLDGRSAQVAITVPSTDLYRITSTATFNGLQRSVEVHVQFSGGTVVLDGATAMTFGSGTEFESSSVPIRLDNSSKISGKDHSTLGVLLLDQSQATYGIASNPIPGNIDLSVTGTGTVEGVPAATTETADGHEGMLNALRSYVQANADISISGSKTLGNSAIGTYGTLVTPKLVYVNLGEENTLTLEQNFAGYGTLFIEVDEAEESIVLRLRNNASWYGLVVVYLRGEAEVESGSLVRMQNNSRIIGGLAMYFNAEEIEIEGTGRVIHMSNSAEIRYSSQLITTAPGLSSSAPRSAEVVSYRLP